MSAEPTNRARLAGLLRTVARPGNHLIGSNGKRHLLAYIDVAEDTIEQQAAMLAADAAELANRSRVRRLLVDSIEELTHDIGCLTTENASLRRLAAAAVNAAQLGDRVSINTIREALEKTT